MARKATVILSLLTLGLLSSSVMAVDEENAGIAHGDTSVRPSSYVARVSVPHEFTLDKAIKQIPQINPGEYFVPPEVGDIPDSKYGDMVRLGRNIFIDTQKYAKRYVGNGLNCANCHLSEGRKSYAAPIWAAYTMYPAFRNKTRTLVTYQQRVQDCFRYSMNGIAPTLDSPEMEAIVAYSHWLSKGAPMNTELPGRGFARLGKPRDPTPIEGEDLYLEQCALCHGVDGQGKKRADGQYQFPPLWGLDTFNRAAGMNKVKTCAQFTRANMPLGKGWTVSEMDAWDTCMYIWIQDRPWDVRYSWFENIIKEPTGR